MTYKVVAIKMNGKKVLLKTSVLSVAVRFLQEMLADDKSMTTYKIEEEA